MILIMMMKLMTTMVMVMKLMTTTMLVMTNMVSSSVSWGAAERRSPTTT